MKPKMEEAKDMSLENIKTENIKGGMKVEDAKEKGDSDQEMLNLENEIYSLTHYADDEEELVAQMFATIKGSKLEAMMPPILKEIPLIDVQQLCLHELRGMSQRRILSIINGQEMSGSSSEDSDEDKPSKFHGDNEDSNMEGRSMEEADDILTGKDLSELENVNESNLTALDILELEMRAKLIKTMLENQDGDDDDDDEDDKDEEGTNGLFDPNIKIKEEPLTPENKKGKDSASPESRRKSKYSRSRRRRRSESRSYSSSSSRSSYSSRSRSYSRSASSRSRSYSSDTKKEASGSPDSKKQMKKKITKKEFEERMKKAKMNRSYRRRKESEEDSGGEKSKSKRRTKKNEEPLEKATEEVPETTETPEAVPTEEGDEKPVEQKEIEEGEEGQQAEEKEVEEKEEGEIDSNEEGAYSSGRSSRSRSRSYSSYSSFYSSRSRSYSRSPRRRRKSKKSKAKRKHRRSRSRSLSDVPKIPNWKPNNDTESKEISEEGSNSTNEPKITLPSKEDRESISFSFNKKNAATIKANSDLNDDGMPCVKTSQEETNTEEGDILDVNDADQSPQMETLPVVEKPSLIEEESSHTPPPVVKSNTPLPVLKSNTPLPVGKSNTPLPVLKSNTPLPVLKSSTPLPKAIKSNKPSQIENAIPVEGSEDFYKGSDQLSFSEEEGEYEEDDVDLEEFLHGDTPVEPINDGDSILRKSVNVVAIKDEPPIASWENKKKKKRKGEMVMEGVGFIKAALSESHSNVDSPMEEDVLPDEGEDSRQEVLEPVQETETEDSRDSHNLEIIGVIDPTDNQEMPFDEDLAAGGSSWSMRWLQSEKVQKVVSNSTLLSKVRKKIQARGKGINKEIPKSVAAAAAPKQPVEIKPKIQKVETKPQQGKSSSVIGSIEEYEKLVGIKVKAPTSLPQPKPQSKAVIQAVSLLDSGDDEDSEEEAIWSKIMKK